MKVIATISAILGLACLFILVTINNIPNSLINTVLYISGILLVFFSGWIT